MRASCWCPGRARSSPGSAWSPKFRTGSGCPATTRPSRFSGFIAACRARRRSTARACSASRSTSGPTRSPPPHLTRELEREYRAVVEEILELRGDDGRISAFLRSITHPGALADTSGYSPDLNVGAEDPAPRDARRRRAAEAGAAAAAGPPDRAGRPQAHPGRRRRRRPEAAARVLPAQADGLDPQGARRRRRLRVGGLPREDCRGGHARRRPAAGRARAVAARTGRRRERRVGDHPHLSRLAARGPVVEALRRAARSGLRAGGARRAITKASTR